MQAVRALDPDAYTSAGLKHNALASEYIALAVSSGLIRSAQGHGPLRGQRTISLVAGAAPTAKVSSAAGPILKKSSKFRRDRSFFDTPPPSPPSPASQLPPVPSLAPVLSFGHVQSPPSTIQSTTSFPLSAFDALARALLRYPPPHAADQGTLNEKVLMLDPNAYIKVGLGPSDKASRYMVIAAAHGIVARTRNASGNWIIKLVARPSTPAPSLETSPALALDLNGRPASSASASDFVPISSPIPPEQPAAARAPPFISVDDDGSLISFDDDGSVASSPSSIASFGMKGVEPWSSVSSPTPPSFVPWATAGRPSSPTASLL